MHGMDLPNISIYDLSPSRPATPPLDAQFASASAAPSAIHSPTTSDREDNDTTDTDTDSEPEIETDTMSPSMSAPKTNTLIVAHLPTSAFGDASTMRALHALFARYGQLYAFAPIKVFRRCIVTYWNPADAERCKRDVDGLVLPTAPAAQIRVFRGAHTPLRRPSSRPVSPSADGPDPFYLAPPRLEKNFLISPPGSPPVGWEPVVEDPPNAAPLASDLIAALHKLELTRSEGPGGGGVRRQGSKGTMEIVYDAPDGVGVGITVSVVDCDRPDQDDDAASDDEEMAGRADEWVYGHRAGFTASGERARFVPTAMPPAGGPLAGGIAPRSATPLPPLRG